MNIEVIDVVDPQLFEAQVNVRSFIAFSAFRCPRMYQSLGICRVVCDFGADLELITCQSTPLEAHAHCFLVALHQRVVDESESIL